MNPFFPSSKPKQKKRSVADSPEIDRPTQTVNSLDMFRVSGDSIKSAAIDMGKKAVTETWGDTWRQILGTESKGSGGSIPMQPGIEYTPQQIAQIQEMQQEQQETQEHIQTTSEHSKYVQEIMGDAANKREDHESAQRIESLIVELRKLASSVQAVEKAVVLQAIGPANAAQMKGKYYENFFEWMLIVIQDARRKVEDSGAWLQTMTTKSKKGQAIGKMKHSMNQFLSGERTAQNQSG